MLILERFEGNIAIIEKDGEMIEVGKECIDENAEIGDILELVNGNYYPDKSKTEKRRKKLTELQNSLWS